MTSRKNYVVLLGNVGAGKSTLVEKMTGRTEMSSAASTSATKTSGLFETADCSMIICDTPGTDCIIDQFQSNLDIANALNFLPVDLILITVKASVRIESVVKGITDYIEYFVPENVPIELIGFCVTHMDTVNWEENELIECIKTGLGINKVIFSCTEKEGSALIRDIQEECLNHQPVKLHVDSEMFLSLFKMNNQGLKILRETRSEVARFENIKKNFYDEQEKLTKIDQINIIFEFQAWMSEEIVEATNRFSDKINSSCNDGPRFATKAGQIANLTNQLRQVLRDVDISAEKFDKNGKSDFRRCPYCGKIWQKKECSEQDTKCGENVKSNESNIGKMANFYFLWDETTEKLVVNKIAQKKTRRQENQPDYSGTAENYKGCGKKITWRKMAPVEDFESSITKCPKPTSKEPKQISPKQSTISSSFFNGNTGNERKPYVIVLGSADAAKTMLMKKLTWSTEKNSSESTLSTKSCKLFESNDGSLTICDTPEISSSSERFQSNLDFAHALNFMAVDLVLIPLKAGKNRDSVEKFLPQEFPKELITFCTNQMDEANFGENEQMKYINKESQELIKEIKDDCLKKKPFEMSVDSKMFSELFELTDHDRSILIKSRKEGERFRKMKQVFYDEWKDYTESEQMDSIFEFQAWIHDEIVRSKKQLSGDKNFKLIITDQNKTDHIGILEDQLHEILRDLRLKVKKIVDKENIEHYKCPYCGKRWPKMDDCKGITKCGEDSCGNSELVERGKMANFFFSWEQDTEKLIISKVSQEKAESQKGCGAEVSWFKMVPVKLRKTVDKIDCASTKDTKPKRKKKWNEMYNDQLDRKKMPEMKKAKDLAD